VKIQSANGMVTQASNVRTGRRLFGVRQRRREQGRIRRSEGLLDEVVLANLSDGDTNGRCCGYISQHIRMSLHHVALRESNMSL